MFARVYYDLESDEENSHYFLTFHRVENEDNQPITDNLPPELLDEMDSFSFESSPYSLGSHGVRNDVPLPQQIAMGISSQWSQAFKQAPFIPVLMFNKINIHERVKMVPIIIFSGTSRLHPRESWNDVLIKTSKCLFYDATSGTATSDHQVAFKLLKKYDYKQMLKAQASDKYNLVSRMNHWYKNDTAPIMDAAQGVIHEFVAVKKYNVRIPGFLVVPAFHISRYRKAMQLLIDKYSPYFIMTLPLIHNNKHWTIMFPVMGDIYPVKKAEDADSLGWDW